MKKAILTDIIAALFVLLFVYAATSKLIDFQNFRVQLAKSPLLTNYSRPIAWAVPFLELMIAVLLTIPRYRIIGFYWCFSLMFLFSIYIIIITRFSNYTPCSCGGVLQNMNWNQHLVFNIAFIIMAGYAVINEESQLQS